MKVIITLYYEGYPYFMKVDAALIYEGNYFYCLMKVITTSLYSVKQCYVTLLRMTI